MFLISDNHDTLVLMKLAGIINGAHGREIQRLLSWPFAMRDLSAKFSLGTEIVVRPGPQLLSKHAQEQPPLGRFRIGGSRGRDFDAVHPRGR